MNKNLILGQQAKNVLKMIKQLGGQRLDYINDAILKEVIPSYIPQLQGYAICLIDRVGHQTPNKELADQAASIEMLLDSLAWMKNGHHIQSPDNLKMLLNYFCRSSWSGGVGIDELTTSDCNDFDKLITELQNVDPNVSDTYNGWGNLAARVLDHWDNLWDCDFAYDALIYMLRKEHPQKYMIPLEACLLVKDLEKQYLLEQANLM